MCCWPLLLLWGLLPGAAAGGSGWTYPHRTMLDSGGNYWLSWGPRGGRLSFRLEVRTAGYVGFGFSPTGAMAAADIVVGGVAHGRPYLQVSASPPGFCRAPRATAFSPDGQAGPPPPQPQPSIPPPPAPAPLGSPPPPPGAEVSPRDVQHG